MSPSGIAYAAVPGNPKAYYALLYSQGQVRELAFGLDKQDCVN
ncbi:hypothetical protein [Nonomuraea sp. NPDC050202]